jgi:hypothetical protein
MDFLFGKKGVWNKGFKFKFNIWSIPFGVPFDAGIEFEKWDVNQSEMNSDNYKLPDTQDLGNI